MNKISYNETYDIICHLDKNLYDKIPKNFLELIKKNIEPDYKVNIDYSKSINDQDLKKDTRILLSLIYRDYLCSQDEKDKLIQNDKRQLNDEEEQKHGFDNIFKGHIEKNEIEKSEQYNTEMQIIKYRKSSFFTNIINKIKAFFMRKNKDF